MLLPEPPNVRSRQPVESPSKPVSSLMSLISNPRSELPRTSRLVREQSLLPELSAYSQKATVPDCEAGKSADRSTTAPSTTRRSLARSPRTSGFSKGRAWERARHGHASLSLTRKGHVCWHEPSPLLQSSYLNLKALRKMQLQVSSGLRKEAGPRDPQKRQTSLEGLRASWTPSGHCHNKQSPLATTGRKP